MRRSDFHFDLPRELIADRPLEKRSASRLLCLNGRTGDYADRHFSDLAELLQPGDLLVLNDTRVVPARLFGRKETGGRVEVLVERFLDEATVLAHVRASKSPRPDTVVELEGGGTARVEGREEDLFRLRFETASPVLEYLGRHGHMPLPPYIERPDEAADRERYQTVYARRPGAVAAPTAGLHFDKELLDELKARGVQTAFVTLHVGAGTFQPVREDDLDSHRMHREYLEVSAESCAAVAEARAAGKRVVAVGTTVVRALESAAAEGELRPFAGETEIFIKPGYRFRVIDALVTNFHLPESTLIMLVSAFAGYDHVMNAYRHAVAERYRFFSYGDAMFLHPHAEAEAES